MMIINLEKRTKYSYVSFWIDENHQKRKKTPQKIKVEWHHQCLDEHAQCLDEHVQCLDENAHV